MSQAPLCQDVVGVGVNRISMKQTPAQLKRQTIGPVPTIADDDPLGIEYDPVFDTSGKDSSVKVSNVAGISGEQLRSFIERIERLNEERAALASDIKGVKSEAKGTGFDVKVINLLLKIRKMDKDDLDEQEALLDVYKRAIGMVL